MFPTSHKNKIDNFVNPDKSSVNESDLLLVMKSNINGNSFNNLSKNAHNMNQSSSDLLLLDRSNQTMRVSENLNDASNRSIKNKTVIFSPSSNNRGSSNSDVVIYRNLNNTKINIVENEKYENEAIKNIKQVETDKKPPESDKVYSNELNVNQSHITQDRVIKEDNNIKNYLKLFMNKLSKDIISIEENMPYKEKDDNSSNVPSVRTESSRRGKVKFGSVEMRSSRKRALASEAEKVGEVLMKLQKNVDEKKKIGKIERMKTSIGFEDLVEAQKQIEKEYHTYKSGSVSNTPSAKLSNKKVSKKKSKVSYSKSPQSFSISPFREEYRLDNMYKTSNNSLECVKKNPPNNTLYTKKNESFVSRCSSRTSKNISSNNNIDNNTINNFDESRHIIELKECELNTNTEPDEEAANKEARALKSFQNVYDSFSEDEIEEDNENFYFQISTKSVFKRFWDILIILLIIYSVTVVPYRLSFPDNFLFFQYMDILVDFIFLFDIFLNFITPYYNENESAVTNPKKIAINYLYGWFVLDLISSVPIGSFSIFINEESVNYYHSSYNSLKNLFAFSKISRFIKWLRIFRLVKFAKNDENGKIIAEMQFNSNSSVNRILKFSILFLILTHISSCIWIFIGKSNHVSWITADLEYNVDNFATYIASVYFTLVTIFTIGYGDITAHNLAERVYNIFLLLFGVVMFSFTISALSTYFSNNVDQRKIELSNKIKILQEIYMEHRPRMTRRLFEKIQRTMKHQHKKTNNEHYQLLETLPTYYRNQLVVLMHKKHIKDLNFFKGQSHDFILFVLPLLKPLKITRGEVLFSVGEYVDEMYMVIKGLLTLHLDTFFDNIEVAQIGNNQHFGEILMYLNEQSPYVLKCKSEVADLLVLRKNDITNIRISFNENVLKILKKSLDFLEEIDKRKRLITLFFKYETNENMIKKRIKQINTFLLKKGFDDYFTQDKSLEEASDLVLSNPDLSFFTLLFSSKFSENHLNRYYQKNSENMLNKIDEESQEGTSSADKDEFSNFLLSKANNAILNHNSTSHKDLAFTISSRKSDDQINKFILDESKNVNDKLISLNNINAFEKVPTLKDLKDYDKKTTLKPIKNKSMNDKKGSVNKEDKYFQLLAQQLLTESKNHLHSNDRIVHIHKDKDNEHANKDESAHIESKKRPGTKIIPHLSKNFLELTRNISLASDQKTPKRKINFPKTPKGVEMLKSNEEIISEIASKRKTSMVPKNSKNNILNFQQGRLFDKDKTQQGNINYTTVSRKPIKITNTLTKKRTKSKLKKSVSISVEKNMDLISGIRNNSVKEKIKRRVASSNNVKNLSEKIEENLEDNYRIVEKTHHSDKKQYLKKTTKNIKKYLEDLDLEIKEENSSDCGERETPDSKKKNYRSIRPININVYQYDNTYKQKIYFSDNNKNTLQNFTVLSNSNQVHNNLNLCPTCSCQRVEQNIEIQNNTNFSIEAVKVGSNKVSPTCTLKMKKESSFNLKKKYMKIEVSTGGNFSIISDSNGPFNSTGNIISRASSVSFNSNGLFANLNDAKLPQTNKRGIKGIVDEKIKELSDSSHSLSEKSASSNKILRRTRRSTTAIAPVKSPESIISAKRGSYVPMRNTRFSQSLDKRRISTFFNKKIPTGRVTENLFEDNSSRSHSDSQKVSQTHKISPDGGFIKSESIRKQYLNKINNGLKLDSYLATDNTSLMKSIQLFVGKSEEKTKLEFKGLKKLDKVFDLLKVMKKK